MLNGREFLELSHRAETDRQLVEQIERFRKNLVVVTPILQVVHTAHKSTSDDGGYSEEIGVGDNKHELCCVSTIQQKKKTAGLYSHFVNDDVQHARVITDLKNVVQPFVDLQKYDQK